MADSRNIYEADFDNTVKKVRRKKKKGIAFTVFLLIVLVVVGISFCFTNLFFVESVDVKNMTDSKDFVGSFPYTQEQMFEGLGIEKGMGLYDFDANEATKNAKYNLPYIESIKLTRLWPSTVVAKVHLEIPTYYVSVDNDLYIVADSLKVLEKTDDFEKIELYSLIHLECKNIHSCIVGEKIGIPEDIEEIMLELDEKLVENKVKNEVSSIDFSDKFNLSLTYGTRYVVKRGDSKSLGVKIEFMKRIIEDRDGDIIGGVIDVSDEKNREAVYKKFN